jgi:hypothetical protein
MLGSFFNDELSLSASQEKATQLELRPCFCLKNTE